jgi:hypothetical protein
MMHKNKDQCTKANATNQIERVDVGFSDPPLSTDNNLNAAMQHIPTNTSTEECRILTSEFVIENPKTPTKKGAQLKCHVTCIPRSKLTQPKISQKSIFRCIWNLNAANQLYLAI